MSLAVVQYAPRFFTRFKDALRKKYVLIELQSAPKLEGRHCSRHGMSHLYYSTCDDSKRFPHLQFVSGLWILYRGAQSAASSWDISRHENTKAQGMLYCTCGYTPTTIHIRICKFVIQYIHALDDTACLYHHGIQCLR